MPQGGASLEQAASVKHYLMKEPLSGDELLHYRFARRKKELVDFDAAESGMTAYFCAHCEKPKGAVRRMGSGCVGGYSVTNNLPAMTAGTGLRPDPATFFVVVDW
jgi:hypothetical protein